MFNGLLKKFKALTANVAELEALPTVKKYLEAKEDQEAVTEQIKGIAKKIVNETKEKFDHEAEGVTVNAWPSFSQSFDLANVTVDEIKKLWALQVLAIDPKFYELQVKENRIGEELHARLTGAGKVLKSVSAKVKVS